MKALICDKWELSFESEAVPENNVSRSQRSYLHFVAAKPEQVAAKCLATEWLLTGLIEEGATLVEYLAGVGIQSVIAREILKPSRQILFERDADCVKHLVTEGFEATVGNANKTMFTDTDYDVKFADFPTSTVISVQNRWEGFFNMFESNPKLVVWTDTACAYPMALHGSKYAKKFESGPIVSFEDYITTYSGWLRKKAGYSIMKVAFRGRNAAYFAAMPEEREVEIKRFALRDCKNGFLTTRG